jgi:hypothetical protein
LFVHFLQAAGALDYLEQKAFGLRMGIYTTRNSQLATEARKRIVLVPIADSTFLDAKFKRLREPPVPRSYHARVIRELTRAGAAVIVFDMLFDLSRPHDNALVKAAREAKAASPAVYGLLWNKDSTLDFSRCRSCKGRARTWGTHARLCGVRTKVSRLKLMWATADAPCPQLSVEAGAPASQRTASVRGGNMWRAESLAIPANPRWHLHHQLFRQAENVPSE